MAGVVSTYSGSARAADPTAALREALAKFKGSLTDEQRQLYDASSSQPDATSVIAFVTELDSNDHTALRQCVAPRISTFLDATRQFVGVVGTFVSSNPTIAALVWGGVKTALLTASNITTYFEQVSKMLMEIGRSCPTYAQFGNLYPGCVGLQHGLCEYFATIVETCSKIIEVSQRNKVAHAFHSMISPFESDFKPFRERLDATEKHIQQQISLASYQAQDEIRKLQQLEIQSKKKFHKMTSKFQVESRKEQSEAQEWRIHRMQREAASLRSKIRKNLSTINHVKPWRQASRKRTPLTAEWIFQEPSFMEWQDDQYNTILWCPGNMGMGKTVLASNIVAKFHANRNVSQVISYYFCVSADPKSLSAMSILGSLAVQILDSQIANAEGENLESLHAATCVSLDTYELTAFIAERLEIGKTYYLIIDGLDQCEASEIRYVVQSVAKLCGTPNRHVKVLYTGRPDLETEISREMIPVYKVTLREGKVQSEMNHYIDTTLHLYLQDKRLKVGAPGLVIEIYDTLRRESHGMFLWAHLFIEELCEINSDGEISKALKKPPGDLAKMFDRILSRVRTRATRDHAIKLLQFCGVLKRPITAIEIRDMLGITPGQKTFDREKLPNDIEKILRDCCGLAFIDEEDDTVHYVHHSVRHHLFAIDHSSSNDFNENIVNFHVGVLCMTYLDFTDFKRQISKAKQGRNTSITPLQLGTFFLRDGSSQVNKIASRMLSLSRETPDISIESLQRKAEEAIGASESSRLNKETQWRGYFLLGYSHNHWLDHLADPGENFNEQTWRLFRRCLEWRNVFASLPWEAGEGNELANGYFQKAIDWATHHPNGSLIRYVCEHPSDAMTDEMKNQILVGLITRRQARLLEDLIKYGNLSNYILFEALFHASRNGWKELVELILSFDVDPNDSFEKIASRVARATARLEIINRMTATNHEIRSSGEFGQTILQAAVAGGHLDVVNRLLLAKAHVNACGVDVWGKTALQIAAAEGHLDIVKQLLLAKADPNACGGDGLGKTALQEAATEGHLDIVSQLLLAKANPNALDMNGYGNTALQEAAVKGHRDIVDLLKENGAYEVGSSEWTRHRMMGLK